MLPPTLATPPKVTLLTPYFSTCQGGYVVGALVPTLPLQVVPVQVPSLRSACISICLSSSFVSTAAS